jgi:hypothetical protein
MGVRQPRRIQLSWVSNSDEAGLQRFKFPAASTIMFLVAASISRVERALQLVASNSHLLQFRTGPLLASRTVSCTVVAWPSFPEVAVTVIT